MQITHSTRDGCLVVGLTGQITVATAPQVQHTLLRGLAEGPLAIVCDLGGVDLLDPVCATVFATVANHPASRWPTTSLLVCGAQPAVAEVLGGLEARHFLPLYETLQEALDAVAQTGTLLRLELPQELLQMGMSRNYLAVPDLAGSGTALREVGEVLWRRQHPGLVGQLGDQPRATSLTAAEQRLLPLLAMHLTFREIGERLQLSSRTVRTQAISIYRKLGVSSRSQAVQHARQRGLLPA